MATATTTPGKVSPVSAKAVEIRDKSLWQKIKDGRLAYLYIAPAAIAMAVITLYPMIFQIWMSFTTYSTSESEGYLRRHTHQHASRPFLYAQ